MADGKSDMYKKISEKWVWDEILSQSCPVLQPQIRKSWDSMENANKKESSDF